MGKETKKSYSKKQIIDGSSLFALKKPLLTDLDIELTERCNNNCIHCYINLPADDQGAEKKEMNTDGIKAVLKEAADLGCIRVKITGGEPLLRKDFKEIYLFIRKAGMKVTLLTNATLISEKLASLFSKIPPLEPIEVSIYGLTRDTYEAVSRTKGSFNAAMKGIRRLQEYKVPFIVKSALLPPNKDEVEQFESWAAQIPWVEGPVPFVVILDLRGRRDSEKQNDAIRSLRSSPEDSLKVITRDRDAYIKEMKVFCGRYLNASGSKLFVCGAGKGNASMDAYGQLQPCLLLRHPDTCYDLKKGSLRDALKNFFPDLRKRKAKNAGYLERCAKCFLKGLCEQCPARSWMEHGDLDDPVDYLCEIAHAQARYLGLLEDNESAWEIEDWQERTRKFTEE